MAPADDFSDDFGWDDEEHQRRERRRKAKNRDRFEARDREIQAEKPKKGFERRPRRAKDWDDEFSDEY